MIIIESALTDFLLINKLDRKQQRLMANLVNVGEATPYIVNTFNKRSKLRPRLKKFGIYVKLIFKDIQNVSQEENYQQLLDKYLKDIGWNDLQYIAFITYSSDYAQIEIILNRVISETKIIDLKCLKASRRQYKMLHRAYTQMCK
ncbi:hypothetical protein NIES2109_57340 (plasmid) [Nostoc sp. HK-01]|nr:hypothetical protein NIES2109_57340 [Nostoc sp. HK-01]